MVTTADPELRGLDGVRPDLLIPLAPLAGPAVPLLRLMTGLREPSFAHARNVTLWWAGVAAGVLLTSGTIIAAGYARFVLAIGVLLAGYAAVRTIVLALFERRQRAFEARWLRAQSELLRGHAFDVVRFVLLTDPRLPGSEVWHLDLTRPEEVDRLLRRQADERSRRLRSRARIEFVYQPDATGNPSIETVRRALTDIEVCPAAARPPRVRIRFPEASYTVQPEPSRRAGSWPARRTSWFLAGPVQLTTAPLAS